MSIAPLRQPDTAHAALCNELEQFVAADMVALPWAGGVRQIGTHEPRRLQERRRGERRVFCEQAAKRLRECGVGGVERREPISAGGVVRVEQLIEQRVDLRPAGGQPV